MKSLILIGAIIQSTMGYYYMEDRAGAMRIISDSPTCNKGRVEFWSTALGTTGGWGSFGDCLGTFDRWDAEDVCQGFGFDDIGNFNGHVTGRVNYPMDMTYEFPNSTALAYDSFGTCSGFGNTCKNCSINNRGYCSGAQSTISDNDDIYISYCHRCPSTLTSFGTSTCSLSWVNSSRWGSCWSMPLLSGLPTTVGTEDCDGLYWATGAIGAIIAAIATWLIIMVVVLSICCLIIIIAICACVFGGVACCAAAASSPTM